MENNKALNKEIVSWRKKIHADSYPMSIGEVINLYRDNELEIHPEFQRFFRWSLQQKTNLIESIFLGIPLPSFFVSQNKNGIWEVIDGLQRLSTIFEFVGVLKNVTEEQSEELSLRPAKYLKSLNGLTWNKIDKSLQLDFKREKIDFKIIKKESTEDTKFEMFQRLNTGGSSLSDQEVRNCILIMLNKNFYRWFEELAKNEDFQECVPLSKNQLDQRYNLELITRFIVFQNTEIKTIGGDVSDFLTEKIIKIAETKNFPLKEQKELFGNVFKMLNKTLSSDTFRRFDTTKSKYTGAISISRYEAITYGLGKNIASYGENSTDHTKTIKGKIDKLCNNDIFITNSGSGSNASTRIPKTLKLANDVFKI